MSQAKSSNISAAVLLPKISIDRVKMMTALDELELLEQKKINELFESVALLLSSNLVQWMDRDTLGQLSQMRDVVQLWLQGESTLTHEQLLATISALTASLNRDKAILFDESNTTRH